MEELSHGCHSLNHIRMVSEMTNAEAKAIIEANAVPVFPLQIEYQDWLTAMNIVSEALEKQIPKKPIKTKIATLNKSPEAISWESIHCCPRCESNLAPQYKYCPQCGLEIDWSDRDD